MGIRTPDLWADVPMLQSCFQMNYLLRPRQRMMQFQLSLNMAAEANRLLLSNLTHQ